MSIEELSKDIPNNPILLSGDQVQKTGKEVMPGELFIAMPSEGTVSLDLLNSYIHLIKPKHYYRSTNIIPLDKARNALVADFLVKSPKASHILFWDDDIVPEPTALMQLWVHDAPIVSGLYFQKGPPYHPLMSLKVTDSAGRNAGYTHLIQWKQGETYNVDGIGMGFCLIRKDVFQNIPWPPFDFTEFSEDYNFCTKARDAGYKISVDTSVLLNHIAERIPIGLDFFKQWQDKLIAKQVKLSV